jgi:hypothetical protein
MNNRETSNCDSLYEYLTGEGTDMQRKRFERHLETCSACKEEAAIWKEVWDHLADDVELIEPPADLKDAVLLPLFEKEDSFSQPRIKVRSSMYKSYLKIGAGAALLAAVFLAGWLLRDGQLQFDNKQEASVQLPANIETLFHLTAQRENGKFEDSPRAYGVACLVRSDGAEQLVVYVFGSPQTQDREAYQVWLLNNGERTSAGTFTVGSSGIGIMTLPLRDGIPTIDSVGVTLEPDSHSSAPRGPKMFGSSEQTTS